MAAGNVSRILRNSGRLIVAPTDAFNGGTYPYSGTEVGLANEVRLTSTGTSKVIRNEGLGEPTDILDATNEWVFTCFLRGWDDDAVTQFFSGHRSAGSPTQHSVFAIPGSRSPGQGSADSINLVIAFVPDNLNDANGLIIYRGIPHWTIDAELAFDRKDEFGIPLIVRCLRNASNNVAKIGRMPDLSLT